MQQLSGTKCVAKVLKPRPSKILLNTKLLNQKALAYIT